MPRCIAYRFDARRCNNQTRTDDPMHCHIHSVLHPLLKCISHEQRTGKRCKRKPLKDSAFCVVHMTTP